MATEEFEEIYKRKFEGLSQHPPEDAWDNISGKAYKNAFESISAETPLDSWNNIQAGLVANTRKKWLYRAAALLLLLFTLGGLFFTSKKENSNTLTLVKVEPSVSVKSKNIAESVTKKNNSENQSSNKINKLISVESVKNTGEIKNIKEGVEKNIHEQNNKNATTIVAQNNIEKLKNQGQEKNIETVFVADDNVKDVPQPIENKQVGISKNGNEIHSFSILVVQNIQAIDIEKNIFSNIDTNFVASEKVDFKKSILPHGFSLGSTFAVNFISTINPSTNDGLDKNSLTLNQANFGIGYGISGEYNISDKHGIEIAALINNQQGHKYSDYQEGKYTNHELKLDYSQLALLYKRKNARIGVFHKPVSFNWIAGAYIAYLKNANYFENSTALIVTKEYKKTDSGIIVGSGYDIYPSNHWLVSTSVCLGVGVTNIFSGNSKIPSNLNETRNAFIRTSIGVKYLIGKK